MDEPLKKEQQSILDTGKKRFAESMAAEDHLREDAIEDICFENGEQWDAQSLKDREGRPCLTINKTAGVTKQILGEARKNRPRIKVRPVDSDADPQVAELLTGLIRNIENVSDAESAYDYGHDCAVRGGYGYWRVDTDYADDDTFDQDILINRVNNQFSVYYDQAAQKPDYSDARYCFVAETMTREEFKTSYSEEDIEDVETSTGESDAGWYSDGAVRIAEYWYKEPVKKTLYLLGNGMTVNELPEGEVVKASDGKFIVPPQQAVVPEAGFEPVQPIEIVKERTVDSHRVMWCKISGNAVLEGPQEWAGKYIPIVPCLGEEIWIEGKRYLRSAIKWAKDPQKLYNWSRSTAAETISLAPKQPWLVTPEMIEDHSAQWISANTKPMPYLLYNRDPNGAMPVRNQASITDTGALNEAMQAADDLKATTGLYDPSLGALGNATSGKQELIQKQSGATSTFIFTDNQQRALKYTGKILVDLIPKIYDTERVVRLLGQDGAEALAQINYVDPMTGEKHNDLSVGKYDVVADVSAGYETKRLEAADGMVNFLSSAPQVAPILLPRIAKNADWPEADEIAEELKAMTPQQQGPDPMMQQFAQMMQRLEVMEKQAGIKKTESETAKNYATADKAAAETGRTQVDTEHKYQFGT